MGRLLFWPNRVNASLFPNGPQGVAMYPAMGEKICFPAKRNKLLTVDGPQGYPHLRAGIFCFHDVRLNRAVSLIAVLISTRGDFLWNLPRTLMASP